MSGRSSCSKLHPERRPGPCAYCNNDHISNRYIHLIQKASDLPDFTNFVSSSYKLSDLDCICRKCEDSEGCSSSDIHHYTEINVPVFEKAFSVSIQTEFPEYSTSDTFFSHLCHSHYNKLNKCINLNVVQCIVCDKFSGKNTGSFKTVSEDKRELFTRYFNFDMHLENLICCPYCYNNFNSFSRSDAAEDQLSKTTEYLFSCLENFTIIDTEKVTTENIDLFSFRSVLESVINSFVEEKALLLPNLFEKYKCILHKNANKLGLCVEQKVFHRPQWLFTMLKSCLGRALSYYVPKKKNLGRMIYRNGTDIFGCLHALVVENCKCIEDNKRLKKESIIQAEKLASTNSQCVQPLHLLCTDIADKFSNSSSTFLSINARLGAGISKDSLRRYITNRCRELEKKQRYIFSDSFIVASFDNLDKNQAYSVVCAGKDRSGFHGTTIQTVVPKPSQKMNMFDDSNLISNLNHVNQTSIEHDISEVPNSRDRKLEKGIIQKLVNPDDKFGLPQVKKQNKFSDMSPSDLKETAAEISEWDEFYRSVTKYGFSKNFFKKENIVLPGIKTFFSIPVESTEKSDFSSVAILDETADSKDTVLKVLNILYDKFQVGQLTNYVIVVGDGKSYDHLIKLKSEYGEQMDWVLAYPGDWHILKNVLPIFVKIYFDAGLRQLATKHHHGATLKVLTECSKFAVTHRFFIQAWEAVMRHQVKSFFEYKSCESPYDIQISDLILNIISDMSLDEEEDEVCKTDVWEKLTHFYLPYRAKTLHNLKSELQLEREEGLYQREAVNGFCRFPCDIQERPFTSGFYVELFSPNPFAVQIKNGSTSELLSEENCLERDGQFSLTIFEGKYVCNKHIQLCNKAFVVYGTIPLVGCETPSHCPSTYSKCTGSEKDIPDDGINCNIRKKKQAQRNWNRLGQMHRKGYRNVKRYRRYNTKKYGYVAYATGNGRHYGGY
ncbi:unnamed protein product [Mytilus edulis]|uniref:DUF6589 domain-containing protein n=1 Tax=Mytilus edulis TaxID=6550 RepID=A0A8S3RCL8_MYTED|nr:unnamed protein product [Mytilus edulis]